MGLTPFSNLNIRRSVYREGDVLTNSFAGKKYVIAGVPGGAALWSVDEYKAMLRGESVVLRDAPDMQTVAYVTDCLTLAGDIHDEPELLRDAPEEPDVER